ncbi:pentapeptide repeat-containing protein [Nocardia australiensis]|uniref:pentapeptide repeat-containing protein n=1 Tax=Nocardia australiensis TaxID=2887191 RepID=UPI001D14E2C6|nr:pentapeptide repeat-containing protein [Nocardia australiensis]
MAGWSGWTQLTALATTIAAVGALWFTNQSLHATDNQYALSQQVAVTDRFQKAVEQLADDDKPDVRLAGIYLLERLAKDSPQDQETIFAVLSAFLRIHTKASACESQNPIPVDVQAVLTVAGRRNVNQERDGTDSSLDFRQTCLARADLTHADLTWADLTGADLTGANLNSAHLNSAHLTGAHLTGAHLNGANLNSANLFGADLLGARLFGADLLGARLFGADLTIADLTRANLNSANLNGANLNGANLTGAHLTGAHLTGAHLNGAHLTRADLTRADLTRANLTDADLTGANLKDIYYDSDTRWPVAFTPPPSRTER